MLLARCFCWIIYPLSQAVGIIYDQRITGSRLGLASAQSLFGTNDLCSLSVTLVSFYKSMDPRHTCWQTICFLYPSIISWFMSIKPWTAGTVMLPSLGSTLGLLRFPRSCRFLIEHKRTHEEGVVLVSNVYRKQCDEKRTSFVYISLERSCFYGYVLYLESGEACL